MVGCGGGSRQSEHRDHSQIQIVVQAIGQICAGQGLRYADQFDLTLLDEFRGTWKDGPLSASKKIERLRSIFKFGLKRGFLKQNYAEDMFTPEVKHSPTLPFSEKEMEAILKHATDSRDKAFILTMRHSGLRISDTTVLAVDSLNGWRLQLYQAKTGQPVSILLPEEVAAAPRQIKRKNPAYFFWTGHSKVQAAVSVWRKRLSNIFTKAKVADAHSHRFRDTFAVNLLSQDESLESVSQLLGHTSIRITQRHYSPWVQARQDALDRELERVHDEACVIVAIAQNL